MAKLNGHISGRMRLVIRDLDKMTASFYSIFSGFLAILFPIAVSGLDSGRSLRSIFAELKICSVVRVFPWTVFHSI